jgi:serine/threonine protein kinase
MLLEGVQSAQPVRQSRTGVWFQPSRTNAPCAWLQVYKAKWNGPVAVKVLGLGSATCEVSAKMAFLREANILEKLRHPHVLGYLGVSMEEGGEVRLAMTCMHASIRGCVLCLCTLTESVCPPSLAEVRCHACRCAS